MKRRVIAAVVAVVLAGVGAFGLYSYVQRADARALAGQETVQVLVVTKAVPEHTPSEQLTTSVESKLLPRASVAAGALTSLDEVSGLITGVDLQPGEQVLASRFIDQGSLTTPLSAPVPSGLQEVSVQLDTQRVVGGNLKPGDTVGMFLSMEVEHPKNEQNPKDSLTHLTYHRVLVTRVQGGLAAMPAEEGAAAMPEDKSVMVTLAVTAAQAEKVVWTAEYGSIWLSNENADADQRGTKIVTEEGLYK